MLGVTPLTVRNWDAKGKLAAYRNPINNYRLYKVEDVEVLMKGIEQSIEKEKSPEPDQPRKLKIEVY